ncbi:MAG: hypothetical protein A3C16_01000 [Candidatus Sungbacteria bacterium RIFCSPHIGHO2_02_FULL_51_29]|uniref:Uncharacterized protein n=1 Tax=Candidatus Sungbacteria bacterium RIFCSPHIGHO2_02_FULL_51_29 TaxID=1802273 RepID=A0A1G2KWY3_9BACT|nr:MAG: hypothetical protein A3C16_01000 [Candidatus Sungbacteria bacterium RIFCSPHIGHO2_02_FULL_51_29]
MFAVVCATVVNKLEAALFHFHFGAYCASAFRTLHEPSKNEGLGGILERLFVVALSYRFAFIKKLFSDKRFVFMRILSALVSHQAVVERILQNVCDHTYRKRFAIFTLEPVSEHLLTQNMMRAIARCVKLKHFCDKRTIVLIRHNILFIFGCRDVLVALRCFAWPFVIFKLLPNASLHIIGQAIKILLCEKNFCFPHKHLITRGFLVDEKAVFYKMDFKPFVEPHFV